MDWTKSNIHLEYLRACANVFDDTESRHTHSLAIQDDHQSMLSFLKFAKVIPADTVWKRGNALPRTSLDSRAIPAQYLAEVAFDYDKDGYSRAADFIRVLEFEVSGTAANDALSEVMSELGDA